MIGWFLVLLTTYDVKLRRNLGHSLLEIARTTDAGAQPPGLTIKYKINP